MADDAATSTAWLRAASRSPGLTKRFLTPTGEPFTAIQRRDVHRRAGPVLRDRRPDRLRQVDDARPGLRPGPARAPARSQVGGQRGRTASPRASASCSRPTRCSRGRRVLGNVMIGPMLNGMAQEGRDRAGPRLAAPGRPGRLRGPLPAPALRRHAQARRDGRGADQRAEDPADGRAVRRARRADQGDHADRAARAVGAAAPVGAVHHPRPGRGRRARRPGAGHDAAARARSRRASTSTCRARAARCRRSGTSRASSSCSTRSGPR